jgi:hypothetical protein
VFISVIYSGKKGFKMSEKERLLGLGSGEAPEYGASDSRVNTAHRTSYDVIGIPRGPPIQVEELTFEIAPHQVHIPTSQADTHVSMNIVIIYYPKKLETYPPLPLISIYVKC